MSSDEKILVCSVHNLGPQISGKFHDAKIIRSKINAHLWR